MKIRAMVVEAKDAPFKVQEIELAGSGRGEWLKVLFENVTSDQRHSS